jgi:hypothetical protein
MHGKYQSCYLCGKGIHVGDINRSCLSQQKSQKQIYFFPEKWKKKDMTLPLAKDDGI